MISEASGRALGIVCGFLLAWILELQVGACAHSRELVDSLRCSRNQRQRTRFGNKLEHEVPVVDVLAISWWQHCSQRDFRRAV